MDGDVGALPSAVALQALRVLQEALANAARHAPGAPVRIEVEAGASALRLSVTNGPGGPGVGRGTGLGPVGMRERAALLGAHLDAGPMGARGWRVELRWSAR